MAEALKNQFGIEIPGKIAGMIASVYPEFEQEAFIKAALVGYEALELMPRGRRLAQTLRQYLPSNYSEAIEILIASLGPKLGKTESNGMAPFLYLPHVCFVGQYGLGHFTDSMRAQYELTQRFSAEFSIRPFLAQHTAATLACLQAWATDPSPHVRRLVSEGTRPRLPWAPRLRNFQKDPGPVLALLESLKDDPEIYVRRSVANNLNDIGKDHPSLLLETARRWLNQATPERSWLVKHALRSAIKGAEPAALAILGFGDRAEVSLSDINITPANPKIGGKVKIAFQLTSTASRCQRLLVDSRIHFIKANGRAQPKVFKLKTLNLVANEVIELEKTISLAEMTTRKHYPGKHTVDLMLNGHYVPLGSFELMPA